MKELLKFSKYLETDFVNSDSAYQSKMDLAISSLVTGDYSKAKQLFDGAIEIDSQFPSAWLGKAFAEIALVDDDGFNSLAIDEYLTRAMRTTDDILKYKVAIAGCLAYRHAVIIKKCVLAVEEALAQQAKAKKERNIAIATAVAGTMFTGKDKSIGSNIVGGALIAGGANHAIKTHLKAQEMEVLGKSIYTAALSQTYLSIPIIHLCGSLESQIKDDLLRANFNVVLDSWKDSVNYLYKKQRDQLVKLLREVKFNEAASVKKFLENPNSIQEVGELKAFLLILGMKEHKDYILLDCIFTETLPAVFKNVDSMQNLEKAAKKQKFFKIFGFVCFFLALMIPQIDKSGSGRSSDILGLLCLILDSVGIISTFWLVKKAKSAEMIEFEKVFNQAIKDISISVLRKEDFNFSLIEKNPTSNNSNTLDS
jgi:hypothetical protein